MTYFVFERAILDEIDGDDTVLEEKPFRALIQRNQLAIYRHDGFWHRMDHYKDYATLNHIWSKGAPWKLW